MPPKTKSFPSNISDKVVDKFYQDILELLDKDHVIKKKPIFFWAGV